MERTSYDEILGLVLVVRMGIIISLLPKMLNVNLRIPKKGRSYFSNF